MGVGKNVCLVLHLLITILAAARKRGAVAFKPDMSAVIFPNAPLIHTNNKHAYMYVQITMPFKASNLFAERIFYPRSYDLHPDLYIYAVYSYSRHWPLLAYHSCADRWFINSTKTSRTTSRHLSLVTKNARFKHYTHVAYPDIGILINTGRIEAMEEAYLARNASPMLVMVRK